MAKKHQIVLPSLAKSTKEKLVMFPLTTKLDRPTIDLLEEHGYQVKEGAKQTVYKLVPQRFFNKVFLYGALLLQDAFHGKFFNSARYPYYLLFLRDVYNIKLDQKQQETFNEYFKNNKAVSLLFNGKQTLVGENKDVFEKDIIPVADQEVEVPVEKEIKKLILLSSNTVGIGKTTTCNKIMEILPNSKRVAFAGFIREQLSFIFGMSGLDPKAFDEPNYSKCKNKPTVFHSDYKPIVLRDLICDYSDLIQKHFGENYWAMSMVDYTLDSEYDYILVDDLRRPIELDYLKNQFGEENILTVYLTKENKEEVKLSETSSNYEGQLDPSTFDIQFTFNTDWSNTPELLDLIKSKL